MPSVQLAIISVAILLAIKQATPLIKNISRPVASSGSLPLLADKCPERSINGIMSSEGSDVSICISKSEAFGNMEFISPRMGDMANPGSDVTAETDQMASSAANDM
jgi:hypothetical protein